MKTWPFKVQTTTAHTRAHTPSIEGIEVIDLDPTLALQIIEDLTESSAGSDENMGSEALNHLIVSGL